MPNNSKHHNTVKKTLCALASLAFMSQIPLNAAADIDNTPTPLRAQFTECQSLSHTPEVMSRCDEKMAMATQASRTLAKPTEQKISEGGFLSSTMRRHMTANGIGAAAVKSVDRSGHGWDAGNEFMLHAGAALALDAALNWNQRMNERAERSEEVLCNNSRQMQQREDKLRSGAIIASLKLCE